jgi:plastocyanin
MARAIPAVFIAALALAGSAQAANAKTTLVGTVGPGFTISLKKGGVKVKTLKPGAYLIKVSDRANIHNFHITGPGVNKKTGVNFTGDKSFSVTLKKGTYRYMCDPHNTQMKGSFTVR